MFRADDGGQRQSGVGDPTDRVRLQALLLHSLVDETRDLRGKEGVAYWKDLQHNPMHTHNAHARTRGGVIVLNMKSGTLLACF